MCKLQTGTGWQDETPRNVSMRDVHITHNERLLSISYYAGFKFRSGNTSSSPFSPEESFVIETIQVFLLESRNNETVKSSCC